MATRSEQVTELVVEIAQLKVRAEILELGNVRDLLEIASDHLMVDIRELMQEERDSVREHLRGEEREE